MRDNPPNGAALVAARLAMTRVGSAARSLRADGVAFGRYGKEAMEIHGLLADLEVALGLLSRSVRKEIEEYGHQ